MGPGVSSASPPSATGAEVRPAFVNLARGLVCVFFCFCGM